MNEFEFLKARRAAELPVFSSVLDALPADRWEYTPHERSPSARQIVWTLTLEMKACVAMVDDGSLEWKHVDAPKDVALIKRAFADAYAELDQRLAALDAASLPKPARILAGGKVMRERPLGEFLWFFFFDAIHHRGQLSTYIRPMGGSVPAIYGPSGDAPQAT
jgi:uncharacterized damage-inducible protein DinB